MNEERTGKFLRQVVKWNISFVTQIFHNGQPSQKIFGILGQTIGIFQVCEALESLRFTDQDVKQMMMVFEEQIDYANSMNDEDRKKSDLFWECTYVSGLVKGNGN